MNKMYNKDKGYCELDNIDEFKLKNQLKVIKRLLFEYCTIKENAKILIAGCGDGREAIYFKEVFNDKIVGIDINIQKTPLDIEDVLFLQADMSSMPLKTNCIDLIYSFHVLEHVENPVLALEDCKRVLRQGSILFIGFPNKNRMLAYISPHNKVTLFEKIKFNLNDIKMRLLGKFDNKYGAHAGFTENFFLEISKKYFSTVYCVRNNYMFYKYNKYRFLLKVLIKLKLSEFIFPSNYYICIK